MIQYDDNQKFWLLTRIKVRNLMNCSKKQSKMKRVLKNIENLLSIEKKIFNLNMLRNVRLIFCY